MPLIYQVAVGEVPPFYETCIESVARYCERYGIAHHVQRHPIQMIRPKNSCRSENALRLGYLPIFEKESAFHRLIAWNNIAIIDADMYIRPDAPNIFDELSRDVAFAGVLERDMPLSDDYRSKIRKHSEGQFSTLKDVDWKWNKDGAAYYNMGMMLFNQNLRPYLHGETPKQFIQRPEFERFVNGEGHWRWSTDQTLLNWWIKKEGIPTRDLSWKWNALYGACRDVSEAYFVHFFLSPCRSQPKNKAMPRCKNKSGFASQVARRSIKKTSRSRKT